MARARRKTRHDLDSAIRAMMDDLHLRMEQLFGPARAGQSESQTLAQREYGAYLGTYSAHRLYRLLRRKRHQYRNPFAGIRVVVKAETKTERDIRKSQTPGDLVRRQRP